MILRVELLPQTLHRLFFQLERIKVFSSQPSSALTSKQPTPPSFLYGLFLLRCARVSRQNASAGSLSPPSIVALVYLVTAGWLHHITGLFVCLSLLSHHRPDTIVFQLCSPSLLIANTAGEEMESRPPASCCLVCWGQSCRSSAGWECAERLGQEGSGPHKPNTWNTAGGHAGGQVSGSNPGQSKGWKQWARIEIRKERIEIPLSHSFPSPLTLIWPAWKSMLSWRVD